MLISQYTIEDLLNDLKANKSIALFLGSGIDVTSIYPDGYYVGESIDDYKITWSSLLKKLTTHACIYDVEENALKDFSYDLKAAVLKHRLKGGYIPIIQEWLYTRCNKTILEESFTLYDQYRNGQRDIKEVPFCSLFVIADLILLQHSIKAVITHNYDNFLSEVISILLNNNQNDKYPYRNINPIDVYDGWKEEKLIDDVFLIYHVHGYIPPTSELKPKIESNHIVLSQEEFYELGEHVFSWQNAVQLYFLTHHTCVFIGLSLNDLTSVRVLKHAHLDKSSERVYVITALDPNANEEEHMSLIMKARYYETQYVYFLCEERGYPVLYNTLWQSVIENKMKSENHNNHE